VGNGGGLTSRRISSWLLGAVVVGGIVNRGAAKEGGWIGRGDADNVKGLSVLMSGDRGPALERVVRADSTNSVKEGGGTFSWFDEGCIVSNGVSGLVNSGVKEDSVDLLLIVVDCWREFWSWWVKVCGGKEHDEVPSSWRVLI
jgi:hypothetical protein